MLSDVKDWLETFLDSKYNYSQGQWVEDDSTASSWFCAILGSGGPSPIVDTRYPGFRLILVGPRNTRSAATSLQTDAESIMAQVTAEDRQLPCGAANVQAIGEPVGPGYTTENRAFYTLDLRLTY